MGAPHLHRIARIRSQPVVAALLKLALLVADADFQSPLFDIVILAGSVIGMRAAVQRQLLLSLLHLIDLPDLDDFRIIVKPPNGSTGGVFLGTGVDSIICMEQPDGVGFSLKHCCPPLWVAGVIPPPMALTYDGKFTVPLCVAFGVIIAEMRGIAAAQDFGDQMTHASRIEIGRAHV